MLGGHFKPSNYFCLLSVLCFFAFSGNDNNVEEGEADTTTPDYTGVEQDLNVEEDEEDYDYEKRRRSRHWVDNISIQLLNTTF